jgi:flagellar basal-body rod protein FlgB
MSIQDYLFRKSTRQILYKGLDASAQRSRAISNNIANVATPDYKRKEVSFEDQVQQAMKKKLSGEQTDKGHTEISKRADLERISPRIFESSDQTLAGEINNVDIDMEMAKLAENQIKYNYSIKFSGFDKYQAAVKGQAY